MRLAGTVLERGRVIPSFHLTESGSGAELGPWDVKGRRALVLAFLHAGCAECDAFAEELAARDDQFRVADADVHAVAPAAIPGLSTLIDADGEVARGYLGEGGEIPTVVLADRYGAAWAAYPGFVHDLPTVGELAATAWHMALQCADCAVPVWPDA